MIDYIFTDDSVAQGVIYVLWCITVLWGVGLIWSFLKLTIEKNALAQLAIVKQLIEERNQVEPPLTHEQRDRVFSSYLKRANVAPSKTVARHVATIFNVGWSGGRLEVSELAKHTTEQLFRQNSLLKAVLGVFIVVGLLGTLLGLAKALVPLASLDFTQASSPEVAERIRELLNKLKSAFAPSIWGVALTVVGVLIYSIYLRYVCIPLKVRLDDLTLNVWVPRLYPTTSERITETFEEADRQARESLRAAREVAQFAESLDREMKGFIPKVEQANAMLSGFNETIDKADAATNRFSNALTQFSGLQKALVDSLYEFKTNSQEVRTLFRGLLEQQKALAPGLATLKTFADTYSEQQEQMQVGLADVVKAAEGAFESLKERNEEVFQSVVQPLVQQLNAIETSLSKGLNQIASDLKEMESPLKEAAQTVQAIAETYPQNTERLLGEVRTQTFDQLGKPLRDELGNIDKTLYEEMQQVGKTLRNLEDPVRNSADRIQGIAQTFNTNMGQMMREVQTEFSKQNRLNADGLADLNTLNENLTQLAGQQRELIEQIHSLTSRVAKSASRYTLAHFLRDKFLS